MPSVLKRDYSRWLTSPEVGKACHWCILLSTLGTPRVPAQTHAHSENPFVTCRTDTSPLVPTPSASSSTVSDPLVFGRNMWKGQQSVSAAVAGSKKKNYPILAGGCKHTAQVCCFQESYKVSWSINHALLLHCSPGWKMDLEWVEKCANACIFAPWEHGETRLDHLNADQPLTRVSRSACFYSRSVRVCRTVHISIRVYPLRVCIVAPQPLRRDESLIPRGLLAAMTSDPFQNNNILNVGFLQHLARVAIENPSTLAPPLIFIHIASSVFFGSTFDQKSITEGKCFL